MKQLIAMLACILLSSSVSSGIFAQTQNVRFSRERMKISEVFSAIEQQTGLTVAYNESALDLSGVVSVPSETNVSDLLASVLKNTGNSFYFHGKMILVYKEKQVKTSTYSGTVVDQAGPVAGAAVMVEGTDQVTVTGVDGKFAINAPQGSVLKVSLLGYKEFTATAGPQTDNLRFLVEEDNRLLDESVVVGYASMKKRDLVGAVDQVKSDVIENRSNGNLARSLQGEIAGLNISFTDSKPSRSASFNVRGTTSVGAGGSSLVLIDGVEGSLNSINPQDVESVSVLKDASSTAVYGARGAFGVILVTTKNPQKGRPVINYNGSVTVNRRTVVPDVITDGQDWLDWWKDCYNGYYNGSKSLLSHIDSTVPYSEAIYSELVRRKNDPSLSKTTTLEGSSMFGWAYMESTDWYDLFYKDYNWSTEHNLSVSGGGDMADYYISGRFYDMDGIYKVGNEDYKKYDLRAKGTLKVRPWLHITNNISMSVVNHYEPKHSRNNFNVQRAINHAAMPLSPVKNPDGSWTTAAAISGYAAFSEGTSWRTNDYMYLREKISADVIMIKEVLKASVDYSYNYTSRKRVDVQNPVKYSKKPGEVMLESASAGSSRQQVTYFTRYQAANAYLTFSPNLGKNNSLTLLAGWNIEEQKYETLNVSRSGIITPSKPSFSLMNGTTTDPVAGGNAWSYVGAFYRLNYSYKGRYLAELSGRYDGSSKFPSNSKWGMFPSGSLAWRISDEPWMKWAEALDNAKVRISAGSMGNGNVAPYSYTSDMSIGTASDIVLGGSLPSYTTVGSIVPVSLTWEKATTYDVGLDLDFFRNRLSFSGDIYRRYTSNMYTVSESLPSVFGTAPPKGNNAEMKTDGFELTLSWRDEFKLFGKPFSYSVKGMLWDSKSVITKYANDTGSLGTLKGYIQNGGSPSSYYVGMTLGEIWGYTVDGLFRDQNDIDNSPIHNFQQASDKVTRPGQVKVKDLDGDGVISPGNFKVHDHGDLRIIGNRSPRYNYGINLAANWNGIGVSVFLQGVIHKDWYPGSDSGYFWGKYGRPFFSFIPSIHTDSKTVYSEEANNWDTAYWPRKTTYQSNASYSWTKVLEIPNTRYIQNAGYLRVKNVQLDYTFNEKLCKKMRLAGLKVYLTGENLFTFTPLHKYAPNYDPEGLSYDSDFSAAADGYTYPVLKSFTLGLNITFYKIMKKILIPLAVAAALTLPSCESFLTQENPNKIESGFYFKDESSLEIYTNGFIRSFATSIKSFIDGDKNADTHSWDGQAAYFMDNYTAEDATNWSTSNWAQLRSINYYLDNMRKASASDAVLDHYEGVGRFFRAMFYFSKMRTFGAVPWYDTTIDPTDKDALYKGRDSREFIASKILEDLNYACEHCSDDSKYRIRASYIHKYVALALKSRFCLYEGTMRKYHSDDPSTGKPWTKDESSMYLEQCIKASEEIMNSGIYSLTDDAASRKTQYRDMFTNADACGVYANEFIWARDYDMDLQVTYAINDYMVNPQHANYAFTRQFINTYLMTDGTPFTTKYADYNSVDFINECKDRDYRLAQTIRTPGFTRDGGKTSWAPDVKFSKTGYQPVKWLTDDSSKDNNTAAIATDVPLMRYAEVLLNYAEAKAELGQMTEDVWNKTIKPLRERSGVKSIYPTAADPYMAEYFQNQVTDPFILEVRRERGIELTMENSRFYDIVRWHQGELFARPWMGLWISAVDTPLDLNGDGTPETLVTADVKKTSTLNMLMIDAASEAGHKLSEGTHGNILPATALQRNWHDYKYVKPIPKTAIQENPALSQNPGWDKVDKKN